MDYPHIVTPQRIRFAREVAYVPQSGHDTAIKSMAFAPGQEDGEALLAVIDDDAMLRVWSTDPAAVLSILPLPASCDGVVWVDGEHVAVRALLDGEVTWWQRKVCGGERWQAVEASSIPQVESSLVVSFSAGQITWTGVHSGGMSSAEAPSTWLADPLARYLVLAFSQSVEIVDVEQGVRLKRVETDGEAIVGAAVSARGDRVFVLTEGGRVLRFEPMRGQGVGELARSPLPAGTLAYDACSGLVAVGHTSGQLSFLDAVSGRLVLRTPRKVPGFLLELPLLDEIGFVGLRSESLGAYLAPQTEILPIRPLPGILASACASPRFPEIHVGLDDGRVVTLNLETEALVEEGQAPWPLQHLCCNQRHLVGLGEGGWWSDRPLGLDHFSPPPASEVLRVALDPQDEWLAVACRDGSVQVAKTSGKKGAVTLHLAQVRDIAFSTLKGKTSLMLIDASCVLWSCEAGKTRLIRVGRLDVPMGQYGRVVAMVADGVSELRLLLVGDQEHRLLISVDPSGAETTLLGSVLLQGTQVVAVFGADQARLRQGEEHSLRVVRDLLAFEASDWLRSEGAGFL